MNLMQKVKTAGGHLEQGKGFLHFLGHKGARYGSAWGYGALKGLYREKTLIGGKVPVDVLSGGILTGLGAILQILSKGRSTVGSYCDAVGDSGMTSYWNSMGASWGAKKSGRQVLVLNAGAKAPATLPAGYTAVGALPSSVGGVYLSDEQIEHYTAGR